MPDLIPVTLEQTGRVVLKGLTPFTPEYVGRLLGKRSMRAPRFAAPPSCLQSGSYYLNMYWNSDYGCCTGSALVEILNMVYGIKVPLDVALAWFKSHQILNGANELDVLNAAESDPVVVEGVAYVIGASSTLDYSNPEAIKQGISSYKAVYWGLDAGFLTQCVGDVSGWVAPIIKRPNTNYDHAVFSPDYGTLDECATYINKQRGVTVTIGSLDPTMPCVTLDTWGTLGIVPLETTITNVTGEAHVIEAFPAGTPYIPDGPTPTPSPNPAPPPNPGPQPRPRPTRRGLEIALALAKQFDIDPEMVHGFVDEIEKHPTVMNAMMSHGSKPAALDNAAPEPA
jgi:hypothetical protein